MQVDRIVPVDARGRIDETLIEGSPGEVFAALQKIPPGELPRLGVLFRYFQWAMPFLAEKPLYAQMLDSGFAVMGVIPLREVVLGRIAQGLSLLSSFPRVKNRAELIAHDEKGFLKVVLSFNLAKEELNDKSYTRVGATLKIWPSGHGGGFLFALLWPLASFAGGVFARDWMRALARRVANK